MSFPSLSHVAFATPTSQFTLESQGLPSESNAIEGAKDIVRALLDSVKTNANFVGTKAHQSEFEALSILLKLVHVEKFVAFHEWNIEASLKAFKEDSFMALKAAGVDLQPGADTSERDKGGDTSSTRMCLICCDKMDGSFHNDNWIKLIGCDHAFCAECLGDYFSECAKSKESGVSIKCPHHECSALMSLEEIENLAPTPGVYETLKMAADDIFVATAEDLCLCPHPGCIRIVR